MDHLPYPNDSSHARMNVLCYFPTFEIVDCNRGPQNTDLFWKRWAPYLFVSRLHKLQLEATICKIQRQLFFGLISWSIGRSVQAGQFTQNRYIDSVNLSGILRATQDCIQAMEECEETLRSIERELQTFTAVIERSLTNNLLLCKVQCVMLLIRILSDSLWRTKRNSSGYIVLEFIRHYEKYKNLYSYSNIDCDILRQRMRQESGQCRAVVTCILTQHSVSIAYCLSSISRDNNVLLHTDCSDSECRLVVDRSTY